MIRITFWDIIILQSSRCRKDCSLKKKLTNSSKPASFSSANKIAPKNKKVRKIKYQLLRLAPMFPQCPLPRNLWRRQDNSPLSCQLCKNSLIYWSPQSKKSWEHLTNSRLNVNPQCWTFRIFHNSHNLS